MKRAEQFAPPDSPVMTVVEVCKHLRIHRSTLYRLIKARKNPFYRIGIDYRFNGKR
jgi:excisionase family DNA binding protein